MTAARQIYQKRQLSRSDKMAQAWCEGWFRPFHILTWALPCCSAPCASLNGMRPAKATVEVALARDGLLGRLTGILRIATSSGCDEV